MALIGIGANGYCRVTKEAIYGTPVVSSFTDLPIKPGTALMIAKANIENDIVIGNRLKPAPNTGRTMCNGELIVDINPATIGKLLNYAFGLSTDTTVGDGAYTHYWLQELTADVDGAIFTLEQAQGVEPANQLTSCMIHKIAIEVDNEKNAQITLSYIAKTYATDVTRATSWSYSAILPYNFSNVTVTEAGLGAMLVDNLSIEIDLGLDIERWKLGDATVKRVLFKKIPQANMTLGLDADQQFNDAAWAHTSYAFTVTFTSTENAGSTPTVYSFALQFPGCRLNPETAVENATERLKHELELDCSYGGLTTNSGAVNVQFEARCTDATAAYSA